MPSPFPGMDPYLEALDLWPDSHLSFAIALSGQLNRTLPRPYYARLGVRPEIGIVGGQGERSMITRVTLVKPRGLAGAGYDPSLAVVNDPRTEVSPSVRMRVPDEPLPHHFVEIRDGARGHALITLIEIVSPSNKRPSLDRKAYEAKQREVLDSDTSLIELDLLRGGEPLIGGPAILDKVSRLEPKPDYLVGISRAWQRGAELDYELFPVRLDEPLPCIPVPLRNGEPEVPLDLQYVFNQAYDDGPYVRGAVDYGAPPDPPVRPELTEWLHACLKRWSAQRDG